MFVLLTLLLSATAAKRGGRKNSKERAPRESCPVLLDEGAQLYNQRRYDEAAAAYRRCIAVEPGNSKAHYNLGSTLQVVPSNERRHQAILHFEKALDTNPRYVNALFNLGTMQKELQLHEAAEKTYEQCIALAPNDDQAIGNLGAVHQLQRRLPEAESLARRALKLSPASK